MLQLLSSCSVTVHTFRTPWTIAYPAPLSMRFARQEYWRGSPFPSPGDLPDPRTESTSPALAGGFFTTEPLGNLDITVNMWQTYESRFKGLPRWLSGEESASQCRRLGFDPWAGKTHWRRKWQPTPVLLSEKSHGQRSPLNYIVHRVTKSQSRMSTHTWCRFRDQKQHQLLLLLLNSKSGREMLKTKLKLKAKIVFVDEYWNLHRRFLASLRVKGVDGNPNLSHLVIKISDERAEQYISMTLNCNGWIIWTLSSKNELMTRLSQSLVVKLTVN